MTSAKQDRLGRAARALAQILADKMGGQMSVRLWTGDVVSSPVGDGRPPFEVTIKSAAALRELMLRPGIGSVARLYAIGEFDFGDVHPMELVNRVDHTRIARGLSWSERGRALKAALPILLNGGKLADPLSYQGEQGQIQGKDRDDQSLIHFHYDLSNRFYELFLDRHMAYSAAYYEHDGMSLDEAQTAKLDLICRKLRLEPGMKLFDTGCGWGSLVCYAAKTYGVHAHGVTLAKEQYDYTIAKIARMGLESQVKIELRECRTVTEPESYDRIAQVGMFEHVGIDNHEAFFRQMHRLLKPRGLYLHQATTRRPTIDLSKFRKASSYKKFATRYIFPGGELDYIGMTVTNLERLGFEVHDVENTREHYQKTCEDWADRLWANRAEAAKEVGTARTRMWLAYLAGTAMAFGG
jgi:cyclopropane-fatty-acyl-phospholipid synthase